MQIELLPGKVVDLGASWVIWVLLSLSVAALAIVAERAVCFWTTRDDIQRLSADLARLVQVGHWQRAEKLLSESPSFEATVALAALGHEDPESADQLMLGASQNARLELERNLSFLGTVGGNAALIGLLGTLVGVIGGLRKLEPAAAWTDALRGEIGESLTATALGLLVALPTSAALRLLRAVVQARLTRADALRRVVLGQLHARRER